MPNLFSANLQDGEGRHIEFRTIALYPDWIKISVPNLAKSYITVMSTEVGPRQTTFSACLLAIIQLITANGVPRSHVE